jgi:hypothetical protein
MEKVNEISGSKDKEITVLQAKIQQISISKDQEIAVLREDVLPALGITQARIDAHGRSFAEALDGLVAFLRHQPLIVFNGYDGEILRENCPLADLPEPFASPRMASSSRVTPPWALSRR